MNHILRSDWLPKRARWSYLAGSGLLAVTRKKKFPDCHITNPTFIDLVLFCEFMDLGSVSVHKHPKKTLPISSHLDLTLFHPCGEW